MTSTLKNVKSKVRNKMTIFTEGIKQQPNLNDSNLNLSEDIREIRKKNVRNKSDKEEKLQILNLAQENNNELFYNE